MLTTIKLHWWFNEKMIREQIVIILCNHGLLSSIFLMRSNVPFDQIITVWFPNDLSHFNFFLVSVKFLYILAACNKRLLWHIDSGIINLLVSYYINEKRKNITTKSDNFKRSEKKHLLRIYTTHKKMNIYCNRYITCDNINKQTWCKSSLIKA